jgi:light-regulated signal transduction histidine kinase (bacteriophytochrome)
MRMSRLIEDLLKFSRVIKRADLFAEVDLGKIVLQVLEDLDERVKAAGVRVAVESLPVIYGDRMQMRQLFFNLISNALKFSDPVKKSLLISITCRDLGSGQWEIAVKDNGIGFEEQYAEAIFRPFERLHHREHYEGNGMGLAICQKIAAHHNGKIFAHASPGEGASFYIDLPKLP